MSAAYLAASNVPRAYHPILAKSAVAITYAKTLPDSAIAELVQTAPELSITPDEMRHIVHATIAARLDPYYRIAGDEGWGYAYDDSTQPVEPTDMQHLQNAMFSRRKAIDGEEEEETRPVGKLDRSRIQHMEDLRRHGNIEEAVARDDEEQSGSMEEPSEPAPNPFHEMEYARQQEEEARAREVEEREAQERERETREREREEEETRVREAAERSREEEETRAREREERAREEKEREEREREEEELREKREREEAQAVASSNETTNIAIELESYIAPTPAEEKQETKEEREDIKEVLTNTEEMKEALTSTEVQETLPEVEIEQQQIVQEVNAAEKEKKEIIEEKKEIIEEKKELARDESFYKSEENELAKEESVAERKVETSTGPQKEQAQKEVVEIKTQQKDDAEALRKIDEEKKRVAEKEKALEERRKRNNERIDEGTKKFQSFLSRTKKEMKDIDKETGLSKKAKAEATQQLNKAVDTGIEKTITSAGNYVDKKISTSNVVDTIIGSASKEDSVWRTIEPNDRRNLAKEASKEVEKLTEQVETKEAKDVAQVDELVDSKQISASTGDRMKKVLHAQNISALNVAVKSFAQSVGKKLGMSSKRFSALMKKLNVEGSKFRVVLERQIRDYAPVVKKVLRELSKDAGVIAKEANKIIGPMLKEYGPIVMDAIGKAGSKAMTEVFNQIPNIVGMVVKSASKTGKSAIGADMDAENDHHPIHTQWQGGSVEYNELFPIDTPDGVMMFPPNLSAADVLRYLRKTASQPGKTNAYWTIYLRLYMFLTQMCRESDDWLKWCAERAPLFLGANPIVLSSPDQPPSDEAVVWILEYAGQPITALNVDMVRSFIELVLRGCVSFSTDCTTHARILYRVPASGIGYDNLSLL